MRLCPLLVVITALVVGGCYSVANLESSEPIDVFQVDGRWDAVAACVPQRLPITSTFIEHRNDGERASVTEWTGGGIESPVYFWQAAFTAHPDGGTNIEIRSANSIWGPFVGPDHPLYTAIESCAEEGA